MEKIINSLLDQDLYKFTMQGAVLELFPQAVVKYRFMNRGKQRFNDEFLSELKNQVYNYLPQLSLSEDEYLWLKSNIPYFKPQFLEYLKNYRFKPEEISHLSLDAENNLKLEISGTWESCILWEVVLLSLISEIYFKITDKKWDYNEENIIKDAQNKVEQLSYCNCNFSDFGTRRRRSYFIHQEVVKQFSNYNKNKSTFVGSSNIHLCRINNIKPVGSCAHEFFMGISALKSLRYANYYSLHNWMKVYKAEHGLGTALSDTYGVDAFLGDFNRYFSMLFDGTRHDSGDEFIYIDKLINHYKEHKINPMGKYILFSNGLSVKKAIEIKEYCEGKIQCSFGIGTHFSNPNLFTDSPPLNIVIKLWEVNSIPVIKLSDEPSKACGEKDAIRVAKYIFFNQPLDF